MNNLDVELIGTKLIWDNDAQCPGLQIDINLNFNKHVNMICKKSFSALENLQEYENVLPSKTKLLVQKLQSYPQSYTRSILNNIQQESNTKKSELCYEICFQPGKT
ncbi:hypothetical protein JTB14_002925 [Gonioctena quinquepunctata]|nr:hypothetical protein JTB14_002925 [Gonioctena quinquepunctata]